MEGGGRFTLGSLPGSTGGGPEAVPFTWTLEGRSFVCGHRGAPSVKKIRPTWLVGSSTGLRVLYIFDVLVILSPPGCCM